MATLTYDPTPADQPEFNDAEQEALKIGEAAAEDQQCMLAGKFKDAEALEQAYIELQKKLGEPNEDGLTEPVEEEGQDELARVSQMLLLNGLRTESYLKRRWLLWGVLN